MAKNLCEIVVNREPVVLCNNTSELLIEWI